MTNLNDSSPLLTLPAERRTVLWWLCLGLIIGALTNIASAKTLHPLPFTDNPFFLPTAVNLARGHGLVNTAVHSLTYRHDSPQDPRFIMHGPLYPLMIRSLMMTPDAQGAYLAVALLRIATLSVLCGALFSISRRQRLASPHLVGLCGATCVVALAGMSLPSSGRPEALSSLLLTLAFTILAASSSTTGDLLASGLVGLTGAAHPVGAALFALGYAAWKLGTTHWIRALRSIGTFVLCSIGVCCLVLSLSPYGLREHLIGMALSGARDAERISSSAGAVIRYYFFFWDRTFFGPAFIFGLLCAYITLIVKYPQTRIVFVLMSMPAAIGIWYAGLREPAMSYNLTQFQPLAYLMAFWAAGQVVSWAKPRLSSGLILTLLLFAVPSLGAYLKFGTEYFFAVKTEHDFPAASRAMQSVLPGSSSVICPGKFWVLFDDPVNLEFVPENPDIKNIIGSRTGPINLVLDSWPNDPEAEIQRLRADGWVVEVLLDFRALRRPSVFRIPITSFDSGYSFVALRVRR